MREICGTRQTNDRPRNLAVVIVLACAAASVFGFGIVSAGIARADQPLITLRPDATTNGIETYVEIPTALKEIYEHGGVPKRLPQLLELEEQQRRVANRIGACTVNVGIGAAQGCGVIVTSSGYILTAAHVGTRPGKTAIITFSDGRTVTARTLGMNRSVDAGLMLINDGQNNGQPWPHATPGKSEDLVAGMWCIACGHPGGFERDRGPVTRVGRILKIREDSIVTDCALIGGDSGGPLFDLSGKLIAVHSRIGNDVADNLHIPIEHYIHHLDRLKAGEAWGFLQGFRPIIGVKPDPNSTAAKIKTVNAGSPAEQAGFRDGDIVEQFGDVAVSDFKSLIAAVADTMPGERVVCWVNRGGARHRLMVEIGREE